MAFQINNFDANGHHPFKGCYPCELNCRNYSVPLFDKEGLGEILFEQ